MLPALPPLSSPGYFPPGSQGILLKQVSLWRLKVLNDISPHFGQNPVFTTINKILHGMGLCYSSKSPPATFSFTYLLQPHWLLCCFLPSTPWSKASDCCSLWSILACDSIMAHYFTLFRTLFKCHLIRGLSSLITLPKIAPPSFSIPAVLNQG